MVLTWRVHASRNSESSGRGVIQLRASNGGAIDIVTSGNQDHSVVQQSRCMERTRNVQTPSNSESSGRRVIEFRTGDRDGRVSRTFVATLVTPCDQDQPIVQQRRRMIEACTRHAACDDERNHGEGRAIAGYA